MNIKPGDKVRLELIATKTDLETRHRQGLTDNVFVGIAMNAPTVGERFVVELGVGEVLKTSYLKRVGEGMITTLNSTYSLERMRTEPKPKTEGE